MYPGRSVWARGVLALGATTLLLICPPGTGHSEVVGLAHRAPKMYSSTPSPFSQSEAFAEPRKKIRTFPDNNTNKNNHILQKRSPENHATNSKKKTGPSNRYRSHKKSDDKRPWPLHVYRDVKIRNATKYRKSNENPMTSGSRITSSVARNNERYSRYHTPRSMTKPVAYVHIQPAIIPPTPTNRKCLRCMIVYKPCPPPPRIILPPSNRYRDEAMKWRGLKYGEFLFLLLCL